jgi:hypothetical protein
LIQAGFSSRMAAIKAVTDTGATFDTSDGLRSWLLSEEVTQLNVSPNWPTAETRNIWLDFMGSFEPRESHTWAKRSYWGKVNWLDASPPPSTPLQLHEHAGKAQVLAVDGALLGTLQNSMNPARKGLLRVNVGQDTSTIDIIYLGPQDLTGV